ncbi:sulfate ABC transporter permease subunit CysT [Brucella inopinata]|uniref:Sulfate transport system permease protein CysT n=1 Tax=Brucella inopinata TaxID=1218315 RepID=A0AAW7BD15_9HYPH|nr:sulfate ABC transporter permease subunit CysT [Brucella inopinata]EFM56946.1 sulfate ABC transporter, permease protein CysT [Brucella inopinata BO1]KEY05182.1 sulfate/thiosulfate transporter subunit [Brucella suis bv. 4 str. 40]MDL2333704.1 sulfate ABC transporter permease subunit CysT [Brucella inopinata]
MSSLPAQARAGWHFRKPSVIPGFGLTFGFSVAYLTLIILIPLAALVLRSSDVGLAGFWRIVTDERTLKALETSFGTAFIAALVNVVFGVILAWVLVRYRFPGRRFVDAIVDIPFALPTAVAGISLAAIYAPNGWIGGLLSPYGIRIAFTRMGIVIALIFIGLPFVVRTVQPIIEEISCEVEEAAATLGASRFQTIWRVLLPGLQSAIITGFALAFARGIGEYGSVIFIAGNTPYKSEIAPLLIVIKLEEYDYAGATALATVMLALSFAMLLFINLIQTRIRRKYGHGA